MKGYCLWVCIGMLCAPCIAQMTSEELLGKYRRNEDILNLASIQGTTLQEHFDSVSKRTTPFRVKQVAHVFYDGERLDSTSQRWFVEHLDEDTSRRPVGAVQNLWYKNQWYQIGEVDPDDSDTWNVFIRNDPENIEDFKNIGVDGSALTGRFSGDNHPISAIWAEAEKTVVRPGTERIGDADCYVVELQGDRGSHTLWIDPTHGYTLRRAEIVKTGDALYYGEPITTEEVPNDEPAEIDYGVMSDPKGGRKKCTLQYEVTEYTQSDGEWVPLAAEWTVQREFSNGRRNGWHIKHRRSIVDFSPDFPDDAFTPRIRNGSHVFPEGDNGIIPLYWFDGEIRPNIDEVILDQIDRSVEDVFAMIETSTPQAETRQAKEQPQSPVPTQTAQAAPKAESASLVKIWAVGTAVLTIVFVMLTIRYRRGTHANR